MQVECFVPIHFALGDRANPRIVELCGEKLFVSLVTWLCMMLFSIRWEQRKATCSLSDDVSNHYSGVLTLLVLSTSVNGGNRIGSYLASIRQSILNRLNVHSGLDASLSTVSELPYCPRVTMPYWESDQNRCFSADGHDRVAASTRQHRITHRFDSVYPQRTLTDCHLIRIDVQALVDCCLICLPRIAEEGCAKGIVGWVHCRQMVANLGQAFAPPQPTLRSRLHRR